VATIRLSTGVEIDPLHIVRAVFTLKGSPISRVRGPELVAASDTLHVETNTNLHVVHGGFARKDGQALEAVGVPVFGLMD
jgi:hypothetical protein